MSLGVILVNFRLAEDRFGDAAVDRVDCATGWDMEDEKQMKEMDQCVVDGEPMSSICSSMCRPFDKLIEFTWVAGRYLCYMLETIQNARGPS